MPNSSDEVPIRSQIILEQGTSQVCGSHDSNLEAESVYQQEKSSYPESTNKFHAMNQLTSFIVWNTRGANDENFKRNFIELIRNHNSCTIALLETKIDNHLALKNEFGFDDYLEVPAQDRSGKSTQTETCTQHSTDGMVIEINTTMEFPLQLDYGNGHVTIAAWADTECRRVLVAKLGSKEECFDDNMDH
ncbi:hypothetical protein HAX54_029852 [Datura stramonium]|uniref:Uncharacterized protein n=1 Tax=Datura stramonium TaxID=4076 RepID=A0ABS8SAJ6_DATST|nr:hypothetical protein [Datura stramonium]